RSGSESPPPRPVTSPPARSSIDTSALRLRGGENEEAMSGQAIGLATSVFLASGVEAVEAVTIVLAMGSTRSWSSALTGAWSAGRSGIGRRGASNRLRRLLVHDLLQGRPARGPGDRLYRLDVRRQSASSRHRRRGGASGGACRGDDRDHGPPAPLARAGERDE